MNNMETLQYARPVKARTQHYCNYCGGVISVGDTYEKSSHKHDGEIYTWKSHVKCSAIASKLKMFDYADDGVTAGDFRETILQEYREIMIKTNLTLYESKDFKYPKFHDQLDFVIKHHS